MNEWLSSLFSRISLQGVPSRRLASVTVGAVLLVWLWVAAVTTTLPEIPGTVLLLVALVVGTSALQPPAA